jgi:hypothetical protein
MGHGAGFRGPLRYRKQGGQLDEALLAHVDALSIVGGDTEHTRVYGFSEDFINPFVVDTGGSTASTDPLFGITALSNSADPASVAFRDVAGGVLRATTSATTPADNDAVLVKIGAGNFAYSTTKRVWWAARIALQDVNSGECTVGLVNTGYSPGDPATLPTNGLFFTKAATATDFTFHARKSDTSTTVASVIGSALADDTFVELAFRVEGGVVSVFVNGTKVSTGIASGDANLPLTSTALQSVCLVGTDVAATRYIDVDFVLAGEER